MSLCHRGDKREHSYTLISAPLAASAVTGWQQWCRRRRASALRGGKRRGGARRCAPGAWEFVLQLSEVSWKQRLAGNGVFLRQNICWRRWLRSYLKPWLRYPSEQDNGSFLEAVLSKKKSLIPGGLHLQPSQVCQKTSACQLLTAVVVFSALM